MTTQDKDLAVAREMLDAEIASMAKTLAERDALCEQQTRTIHGIPALMRERDAEKARADAAEQMVCEMRDVVGALVEWADIRGAIQADDTLLWPVIAGARHYIARTEPVAGRWVPWSDFERSGAKALVAMVKRDAAIAAKEAAESREHALGVQVVAMQKRLALFEEGAALLRDVVDDCEGTTAHYYRVQRAMIDINVGCFLAKVDAVPGDALATCKPGLQVGVEASGVDVERVSAPAYEGEDEVTP